MADSKFAALGKAMSGLVARTSLYTAAGLLTGALTGLVGTGLQPTHCSGLVWAFAFPFSRSTSISFLRGQSKKNSGA